MALPLLTPRTFCTCHVPRVFSFTSVKVAVTRLVIDKKEERRTEAIILLKCVVENDD